MTSEYSSTRVRGMAPWRPQARTRVLLDQIQAVLAAYANQLPLSARQVFYLLVVKFLYEKTEKAYERLLEKLNRARRARIVPFDAIRDDGLTVIEPNGFDGTPDFWRGVAAAAGEYQRNRQADQPFATEVWVEAGGMVPQVARVVAPYGVPIYSSGGFDSVTAKYAAARRIMSRKIPTVVLHIGDHDPSGLSVYDSAADDVSTFVSDLGRAGLVEFRRVAVTAEQATLYNLPTAPPKPKDKRGQWTGNTTQAEALDPAILAAIVQAAIEDVVDLTILAEVIETEGRERTDLVAAVRRIRGTG